MKLFGALVIALKMMKSKSLFYKLFPTFFLISLLGILSVLFISKYAFQNFYYQESIKDLSQKSDLIHDEVAKLFSKSPSQLLVLTKSLSQKSDSRITIVNSNGEVLADSHNPISQMDNHQLRPEIKSALAGTPGNSIRLSDTENQKYLYVALPLTVNGKVIGAIRNSISLSKIEKSLYDITQNIIFWSAILFIFMGIVIYVQSKKISAPLEELNDRINKFALENFDESVDINITDTTTEVTTLFSTLNSMSEKITTQFEKINKQKNEQLAVFASMLEGVITIYPDLGINHINKAALKLFSYKPTKRIKGTPLFDVVNNDEIIFLAENLIKTQKQVDDEIELENGLILNLHGTILESNNDGIRGAVLVFNDITKIRKLESHRKQFVANVSHELKTPLTAIQGYLETVQDEQLDDINTIKRFLKIINKHSIRLKTIIEDLLMLSSLDREANSGEVSLMVQNILPPLQNVISLCKDKADEKNIKIELFEQSIHLPLNAHLIEQALINLIDNAIKYSPQNSKVEIHLSLFKNNLRIEVKDQGAGIDPKHHERLFERFYSANKARSRELGGSGLGLSIVKNIILLHSGNIYIESEPGKGSSFFVELPLS